MTMNKYFRLIEDEAELDKLFDDALQNNLSNTASEAAQFFSTTTQNELDNYRRQRLSRLLIALVSKLSNSKIATGVSMNMLRCPKCGEQVHTRYGDGLLVCRECSCEFTVKETP